MLTSDTSQASLPTMPLAAYESLRSNVVECAKHARTLFLGHVTLNTYGLMTLATMKDADFFVVGRGIKLPIVDIEVSPAFYLPGLALLSVLTFMYFQLYLQHMWTLQREVDAADPGQPLYVPASTHHRYPWIAFIAAGPGFWNRIAGFAFDALQWGLTPILIGACWTRAARCGSNPKHWFTAGIPWAPVFGAMLACVLITTPFWAAWYAGLCGLSKRLTLRLVVSSAAAVLAIAASRSREVHPLQLRGSRLERQLLGGIDLTHARMEGANLLEANLSDAKLVGTNLARARLERANLERAQLWGANLSNAKLSDAKLSAANLSDADLSQAILPYANLSRASLSRANLSGVNLNHANLVDANLGHANLERAKLLEANLSGANLRGAILERANLGDAGLTRANLERANLERAYMSGARLSGANLERANLSSAKLGGADFSRANLRDANLSDTDLERANLSDADLTGANLHGAYLEDAIHNDKTRWPNGFDSRLLAVRP